MTDVSRHHAMGRHAAWLSARVAGCARLVVLLTLLAVAGGCRTTPPPPPTQLPTTAPTEAPQTVVLTLGSWRTDDVAQMNRILARFHQMHPNIIIQYEPIHSDVVVYNAALKRQFANGSGPDLYYLTSYSLGRDFYDLGYLAPLGDLPGLRENFTPEVLAAWATDDGQPYGVPFIAVSHGIYYNADLFAARQLPIPQTWEELLSTAATLQAAGITPFANGLADQWDITEIVFMNLAPNFLGGRAGRLEYLTGQRCFNDAHVVAAFQAVADLAPYLPQNPQFLTYYDGLQIFIQGKAAMWLGGSWDIPFFEAQAPNFAWSVFAPPPPAGQPAHITFQLDAGMGLNPASPHQAAAREFLTWMTTPEFAALLGNELPGFFPMHMQAPVLTNEHANTFLLLNQGRGTDIRFAWDKLNEGTPDGYSLMQAGALAVVQGQQTAQQAADALQAGLARWFAPAQQCAKDE